MKYVVTHEIKGVLVGIISDKKVSFTKDNRQPLGDDDVAAFASPEQAKDLIINRWRNAADRENLGIIPIDVGTDVRRITHDQLREAGLAHLLHEREAPIIRM